jgi:oligopeptide/dipeptide ABC transporter ATP-binding protein
MTPEARHGSSAAPLLSVAGLTKRFAVGGGLFGKPDKVVHAVDDVSFTIARGEVLGLVGESGSGKTTVGQTVLRLTEPTEGAIRFDGQDLRAARGPALMKLRQRMQIVFQDPFASLNPRMRIGDAIAEPLDIHGLGGDRTTRRERVRELLDMVGLRADFAARFPHEFSGGQRQRIGIARALATRPDFVVADELVSALDVSIQAQVLSLIEDLQARLGLAMLLVAHDLAVVQYLSTRVAIMYLGRIVEIGPTMEVYARPRHPYTRALLSAIPTTRPEERRQRVVLQGDIPSPLKPPSGCHFRTRCPFALPACAEARPPLAEVSPGHAKACIRDDL